MGIVLPIYTLHRIVHIQHCIAGFYCNTTLYCTYTMVLALYPVCAIHDCFVRVNVHFRMYTPGYAEPLAYVKGFISVKGWGA